MQSQGRERGLQSFVLHPQFGQAGTPGFGKLYTFTDSIEPGPGRRTSPRRIATSTHDTVLHEWTAKTPGAASYDGGAPRELIRLRQPFANHNGGADHVQPAGAAGQRPTSASSTSASPTAAAAAIR